MPGNLQEEVLSRREAGRQSYAQPVFPGKSSWHESAVGSWFNDNVLGPGLCPVRTGWVAALVIPLLARFPFPLCQGARRGVAPVRSFR
jgi:hypothetical protein